MTTVFYPTKKETSKNYKIGEVTTTNTGSPMVTYKKLQYKEPEYFEPVKTFSSNNIIFETDDRLEVFATLEDGEKVTRSEKFSPHVTLVIPNDGVMLSNAIINQFSQQTNKNQKTLRNNGWYSYPQNVQIINNTWPEGKLFDLKKAKVPTRNSFMYELIYSGNEGKNISLTYREYTDNLIRSAFSQKLNYNLENDSIIQFRDLKIKIISFSNSNIVYQVLGD